MVTKSMRQLLAIIILAGLSAEFSTFALDEVGAGALGGTASGALIGGIAGGGRGAGIGAGVGLGLGLISGGIAKSRHKRREERERNRYYKNKRSHRSHKNTNHQRATKVIDQSDTYK